VIPDAVILRESSSIRGKKGTKESKQRDPEKMREAGRLGGLAKAKNRLLAERRAKAAAKKAAAVATAK
jgi:general stress protein YciG